MKSEASYLSLAAKNRSLLESPKFKEEQPEPSIEILMPPEVLITDNMETFPEIPKELAENFIIDFPVNLELSNYIIFMPSDILKKEFNGGFIELPVLLRNMWNNVIYSKSGSDADKKGNYQKKDAKEMEKEYKFKKGDYHRKVKPEILKDANKAYKKI